MNLVTRCLYRRSSQSQPLERLGHIGRRAAHHPMRTLGQSATHLHGSPVWSRVVLVPIQDPPSPLIQRALCASGTQGLALRGQKELAQHCQITVL